ncbi:MAG: putative glutamine amidotransferase [candidate division WS2 bacterium]|nr:putative glutamine amidotransferase [Candidatus Lithacetigena glycinireducens]
MSKFIAISGSSDETISPYIEALKKVNDNFELITFFPEQEVNVNISIQGLLLTGGGDVDEGTHYEEGCGEIEGVSKARDELEFSLLRIAYSRNLPVLGICRGHQMINAFLGGTLFKDLPCRGYQVHSGGVMHEVTLNTNSFFGKKYGLETSLVNSYHHQGVSRLAPNLTPWVYSADYVLEAFEGKDSKIIGVQWHPERSMEETLSRMIFENFLEKVSSVRNS